MIRRFLAVVAVVSALIALASAAIAEKATRTARIGLLAAGAPNPTRQEMLRNFANRMQQLGYVEGKNIAIERRWARDDVGRLQRHARELVASNVDVIVTLATPAAFAARRATSRIPIVMGVASGSAVIPKLVKSLHRPGGNVTGMVSFGQEMTAKRLELAKEIVPSATRIAILGAKDHPGFVEAWRSAKAGADALGVTLLPVGIRAASELDAAFSTMVESRVDAFVVAPGALMGSLRGQIAARAAKVRLPAILPNRPFAEAGGLVGYGSNLTEMVGRAAFFVDRILRGANPAELPVERETRFVLVVNLKAAKALRVTVPPSILLRADKVIE